MQARSRPCSEDAAEAAPRHPGAPLGGWSARAALAGSLWEIAIKKALGRADFRVEPRLLRRGLLDNGYVELPVASQHAVSIDALRPRHKDPFDRLLLAQATTEGMVLVTADAALASYPGPVRKV